MSERNVYFESTHYGNVQSKESSGKGESSRGVVIMLVGRNDNRRTRGNKNDVKRVSGRRCWVVARERYCGRPVLLDEEDVKGQVSTEGRSGESIRELRKCGFGSLRIRSWGKGIRLRKGESSQSVSNAGTEQKSRGKRLTWVRSNGGREAVLSLRHRSEDAWHGRDIGNREPFEI